MEPELDEKLSELWYDLRSSAAFGGLNQLYRAAKKQGLSYSKTKVQEWLKAQPAYSINYPRKYKFRRNRIP